MPGVFDLKTAADLLAKLERELERMRAAPNDADHAFNFFVTAEHIIDWKWPGRAGEGQRKLARQDPVLALVSHLASGAKHFDHLSPHHQSVARSGLISRHPNPMMRRMMPDQLMVVAGGAAGQALGGSAITTLRLAEHVCGYWKANL